MELTYVGYRGAGPALQDLLGGTIPAMCSSLGTFFNQPNLRLLATSGVA